MKINADDVIAFCLYLMSKWNLSIHSFVKHRKLNIQSLLKNLSNWTEAIPTAIKML